MLLKILIQREKQYIYYTIKKTKRLKYLAFMVKMSISIKLYNKIYKQIDTINNKYTMNFDKLINTNITNITNNCYDLVKNTKQELKELGDF